MRQYVVTLPAEGKLKPAMNVITWADTPEEAMEAAIKAICPHIGPTTRSKIVVNTLHKEVK